MKKYQKKRDLKSELKASTPLAIWPEFKSGDPEVNTYVYRWFSNDGDYLGWTTAEDGKKFLIGKLYYKTKGAYRIQSKKSWTDRTTKKIFIYEKNTSYLAGYAVYRQIKQDDLVDLNDREALAKASLEAINKYMFSGYNLCDYPNKYKIIPDEMKSKIAMDMQNFLNAKKQELTDYLNQQITDAQQAKVIHTKNTEALAGEWDMTGIL